MQSDHLVARYSAARRSSEDTKNLEAWIASLGLFPPEVEEMTEADLAPLPAGVREAARRLTAWALAKGIIAADPFAQLPSGDGPIFLATLFDLYLENAAKRVEPATLKDYRWLLRSFTTRWPGLTLDKFKSIHVTRWLDDSWEPDANSTRRTAITIIKAAMKWAADQDLICETENPIRRMKMPKAVRRERLLTDAEHQAIFSNSDDCFRDFLTALHESGARPGEVAVVEPAMVDLATGTWVIPDHKTVKKTGRPRVIYLSPALLELTRKLLARSKGGELFRNSRGRPWKKHAICDRFEAVREKLKMTDDVCAYAYRHTYITDLLGKGVPPATVAELVGHEDLTMISRHYGHVNQLTAHLRDAAARGSSDTAPTVRGLKLYAE